VQEELEGLPPPFPLLLFVKWTKASPHRRFINKIPTPRLPRGSTALRGRAPPGSYLKAPISSLEEDNPVVKHLVMGAFLVAQHLVPPRGIPP